MTQISELHDASSKPWIQLSSFTALVFLFLTQNCSGLSQVVSPSQPVQAKVGDDVVLSCRLEPAVDASDMSVEWSRQDLDPIYVYVWWNKEELESSKHPDYNGRTSLLVNELEFGNISLKLSKVRLSDKGKYRCFVPTLGLASTVELIVVDSTFTLILAGLVAGIILTVAVVVAVFVHLRRRRRPISTGRNLETERPLELQPLNLTRPIILEGIHPRGFYIRLRNISSEVLNLTHWDLELQINDKEPERLLIYKQVILRPGGIFTICHTLWGSTNPNDVDMKARLEWKPEDKLQIKLISKYGKIIRLK